MGMYKYVKQSFARSLAERSDAYRKRITEWRGQNVAMRVENPLNPVRAHELGYKAKKGFAIVRVRVAKGKRKRRAPDLGRKPGKNVKKVPPGISLQRIAERKVLLRHANMRVIGSYVVGEDGTDKYFEVILHDKTME